MKKVLRWLLMSILAIILCIALFLGVVTVFAIPVELTRFKPRLEAVAEKWLERPVKIEGSIVVATSLKPSFRLTGLRIQNPENFTQKDFLLMDEVHIQLSVLPLLQKKIHIPEFKVHGLAVTLEENEQKQVNWVFADAAAGSEAAEESTVEERREVPAPTVPASEGRAAKNLQRDSLVVENLDLQEISVAYYSSERDKPAHFLLSKCDGVMTAGQPLRLDIDGKAAKFGYTINASLASLEEFLTENRTWVEINIGIAKTDFSMSGNLDLKTAARSLQLAASVKGENLSDLGEMLQLDLPPFSPYSLTTQLRVRENLAELEQMQIEAGKSSLTGKARIEKKDEIVLATIDLHSPLVQIDDFVFDDWSWEGGESQSEEEGAEDEDPPQENEQVTEEQTGGQEEKRNLFDPEWLKKFDCSLSVAADSVESGDDFLGGGKLLLTLNDGRLALAPLSLELPGGGIEMEASFQPGNESSEGSIKVLVKNFDIGILVRRSEPESDMGGIVNLNIDLHSEAATLSDLLRSGDGYIDFSGNLENFKSGIIDLWAVNLISAIVSSTKENQSQINCAVGRWSSDKGYLSADAFFVDTSKIRICAEGNVNLQEERLNIKVSPKAKRAEFFSLATPVKIKGTFADLNVKLGKGDVFSSVFKMIVSPVTTPLKRIFTHELPSDGSDVCNMTLGPDYHKEVEVPGCN